MLSNLFKFGRKNNAEIGASTPPIEKGTPSENNPISGNKEDRPGFFRRIANSISSLFSGRSKTPPNKDPNPSTNNSSQQEEKDSSTPPEFKDINIQIEETEMLLAPGMDKFIRERGLTFWKMGFMDGVNGIQSEAVDNIAKGHAVTLVEFVRASSQGKIKAYKSDMIVKKSIMNDEEDRYRDAQRHLDEMTHMYHKHPRSFSWILFWLYFGFAIFLIVADVPLAKSLTEKGFDLEVGSLGSWLLTLGVAFCAVYIKIYYDDYVATSIGHFTSQFKKIPGVIGDKERQSGDENDDEDPQHAAKSEKGGFSSKSEEEEYEKRKRNEVLAAKAEYWMKFCIKTLILYLTLRTIWILGAFRYQNISNPERDIIMEYVNWVVQKMGKNPAEVTLEAFSTTLLAFRMITLIFPIVGGVCLSLAMTNLQNLKRHPKAKTNFDLHQQLYLKALENYNNASKKYQDFKGIADRWNDKDEDDQHVKDFQKVFMSYYNHGHENGIVEPDLKDTKSDLYAQVEKMRRKLVARRVNNVLIKESQDAQPTT
ncbi:MAG: hypothetical protein ACKVQV_16140 [Bacteroidia bacterium]